MLVYSALQPLVNRAVDCSSPTRLPLESIQQVRLRSEGWDEALVVHTADDEFVIGRSEAAAPLRAVLVPLQQRVRARRAAVRAAGANPDANAEIPVALQALRQRSR